MKVEAEVKQKDFSRSSHCPNGRRDITHRRRWRRLTLNLLAFSVAFIVATVASRV